MIGKPGNPEGGARESTELVYIPKQEERQAVRDDVEDLDFYPGDIDDFSDSIQALKDFHIREYEAITEIRSKYKDAFKSEEVTDLEGTKEAIDNNHKINPGFSGAKAKAASPEVKQKRREVWKEVLKREDFQPEEKDRFSGLLNLLTENNLRGHLEQILKCIQNAKDPESVTHLVQKCDEIYINLLEIERLSGREGLIQQYRYLDGVNLLNFFDASTPAEGLVIDWDELTKYFGVPTDLEDEEKSVIKEANNNLTINQTVEGSEGLNITTELSKSLALESLPSLYESFIQNPNRENAHIIEKALVSVNDAHFAVCMSSEEGVFAIVQTKHGVGNFLADPKTGRQISQEYKGIVITPHRGLFQVRGKDGGQGYIKSGGQEVLKPQPGNFVPRYHNGAEVVFDGFKVVNLETTKIIAQDQGGDEINVFGNLVTTKVLLEQRGFDKKFETKVLGPKGNELDLGSPDDIEVITKRTDVVPYTDNTGRSEITQIITNVAFKKGHKYGLANALTGEVIFPPEYKSISSFYAGFKYDGSRLKPIFGHNHEVVGHEEIAAKVPIDLIVTEKENEGFMLLDENYINVLSRSFETMVELEASYDKQFPRNTRHVRFLKLD